MSDFDAPNGSDAGEIAGGIPPEPYVGATNDQNEGAPVVPTLTPVHHPDLQQLQEMLRQQTSLLASFMQQQARINESLLKTASTSELVRVPAGNTTATPALACGLVASASEGPIVETVGSASSSVGEGVNIAPVSNNINNNLSSNLPGNDNLGMDWKSVALALTAQSYRTTTMEKPSFRSPESQNPVLFLQRLDRFIRAVGASPTQALDIVKDCLTGPASEWMDMTEGLWTTIEHFKRDFLAFFWSEERQYSERVRLGNLRYSPDRSLTMTEFFLRQVSAYRLFSPPIPEALIISEVMRQLPVSTQSLWATVSNRTLTTALEFLERQVSITGKRLRNTYNYASEPKPVTATAAVRYSPTRPNGFYEPRVSTGNTSFAPFSVPPPSACTSCRHKRPNSSEN